MQRQRQHLQLSLQISSHLFFLKDDSQLTTRPHPAECNNSVCFPGIGLGAVLCRARLLSAKMLVAAVQALAAQSPALKDPDKGLVPDVAHVRELSVHIAKAVIRQAVAEGLAQEKEIPIPDNDDDNDAADLEEWIREQMWTPEYRRLNRVDPKSASRAARGLLGTASSHRPARS